MFKIRCAHNLHLWLWDLIYVSVCEWEWLPKLLPLIPKNSPLWLLKLEGEEKSIFFYLKKKKNSRIKSFHFIVLSIYLIIISFQWCLVTGKRHQGTNRNTGVLAEHQKTFLLYRWLLTQIAHRGCGVSIFGDTEKPLNSVLLLALLEQRDWTGWSSVIRSNLHCSMILWNARFWRKKAHILVNYSFRCAVLAHLVKKKTKKNLKI